MHPPNTHNFPLLLGYGEPTPVALKAPNIHS